MSNRKSLEKSMEDIDEEEEEHAKLMKTQDEYEKQSMHEMPKLDDQEYARMIEISESHGLGDVNMEDFQINDDDNEEEKLPLKNDVFSRELKLTNNDEEEDKSEDSSQKSFSKKGSAFNCKSGPHKNQELVASSFIKRTTLTRDSESSSRYITPQKFQNVASFGQVSNSSNKPNSSLRKDPNEAYRQEIVQQVRVRVEELQSKMKSKSDMFYVMRHMCKKYLYLNQLRWIPSPRIWWLTYPIHERYSIRS